MPDNRLTSWAPVIWALAWFTADALLKHTTWLGPQRPGGLKEAQPTLWLVSLSGFAGLIGYQAFKRARLHRGPRALAMAAFILAFSGGYPVLGDRAWGFTVIALFLIVVASEVGASVIERRQGRAIEPEAGRRTTG